MLITKNSFLVFTLFIMGSFGLKAHIQYYSSPSLGKSSQSRVEAFVTELDLEDWDSEKNKKKIKTYKEEIGLNPDSPIIIQSGAEGEAQIADFIKSYKLKNPVLKKSISKELELYHRTGELGEKLKKRYIKLFVANYKDQHPKADPETLKEAANFILSSSFTEREKSEFIQDLKNENWENTEKALAHYRVNTNIGQPLGRLPYAKNLSKSTFTLTTIRVIYNTGIATAVTFASTGSMEKSLAYGTLTASMTALVQLNSKFFERVMSGKFWVPIFWGFESAFIAVMFGASYILQMQESGFDIGHFLFKQIALFGGLTTLTQASAEYFASSQGSRMKKALGNEIIKIKNSKTLSAQAKSLLLSRLTATYSLATETYARVMVLGSAIWATSMAFEAALPNAYKAAAVYGTFALLGAYSLSIKAFGINRLMNTLVTKPLKLGKKIKVQVHAFHKETISRFKKTFCSSLLR